VPCENRTADLRHTPETLALAAAVPPSLAQHRLATPKTLTSGQPRLEWKNIVADDPNNKKGRLIAGFLLTSALVAEFNRGIVLNLSSLAAKQGRELPEQGTKALPSPCADGMRAPPGSEWTSPAALTPDTERRRP
jgi:hypothetical protein